MKCRPRLGAFLFPFHKCMRQRTHSRALSAQNRLVDHLAGGRLSRSLFWCKHFKASSGLPCKEGSYELVLTNAWPHCFEVPRMVVYQVFSNLQVLLQAFNSEPICFCALFASSLGLA